MTVRTIVFAAVFFQVLGFVQAHACTAFSLTPEKEAVVGVNMDWVRGEGLVVVNKRGMSKIGIAGDSGKPAAWVSRYGSVTLNLGGREFAFSGINEKGLVVCGLLLPGTTYPAPDNRDALWGGQFQQYLLDNYATVEEVIKNSARVRIWNVIGLHYYIQDTAGSKAVIEFVNGKLTVYTDTDLPVCALENNPYAETAGLAALPDRGKWVSRDRALFASQEVQKYKPRKKTPLVDFAFNLLGQLADKGMETQWSIVFDSKNLRLWFRTRHWKPIRWLDLASLDFSCSAPVKIMDIQAELSGNIENALKDYDGTLNKKQIETFFAGVPENYGS